MQERDALRQQDEGVTHGVCTYPIRRTGTCRMLVLADIPKRLIVVFADVVDRLLRILRVSGVLAHVVDVIAGDRVALGINQFVIRETSGQPDPDVVGLRQQIIFLAIRARVLGIRIVEAAADEALVDDVRDAAVERPTAAHRVTQAIIEAADAGPAQVLLRGLDESRVVDDVAEVPGLAVHVDLRAIDTVVRDAQRIQILTQLLHGGLRMEAHEVEAEAIHFVLLDPEQCRVNQEFLHHRELCRGIVAAGIPQHVTGTIVQAVVVTRDDLVQHGLLVLAGVAGVIVDHVHHGPETRIVEALHHAAELEDTLRPVRIGRVAAFRCVVMEGVVTPVEAVQVFHPGGDLLLLLRVARQALEQLADRLRIRTQARRRGVGRAEFIHRAIEIHTLGLVLIHSRDIEGRQHVQVRQTGGRQLLQVLPTGTVRIRKGGVLASVARLDEPIVDAEVADVRLVDDDIFRCIERRLDHRVPSRRLQVPIVHVHDLAEETVGGQADRIGVGDLVRHQRLRRRRVDR